MSFLVTGVSSVCGHCWTPKLDRDGLGDHGLLDRPVDVRSGPSPAGTACTSPPLAEPVERGLELGVRPVRVLLLEDRGGARDMRGRHRRTGDRQVAGRVLADLLVDDAARGRGGGDVHAGRGDVRLDGAVDGRGPRLEKSASLSLSSTAPTVSAAAALPGEPTVVLAQLALVAGGDREEDALLGGELVDRRLHRVDLGGVAAAEAEVDDVGALLGGPLHAGDDAGVVAVAVVVEHLAVEELRAGRDALVLARRTWRRCRPRWTRRACRGRTGRRCRRTVEKFLVGDHLALEVRVGRVDAGVQDGDLDALAVVAGLPRPSGRRSAATDLSRLALRTPSSQTWATPEAVRAVARR